MLQVQQMNETNANTIIPNTIQKRLLIDRRRQKTVTRAILQKKRVSSLWLSIAFSKQIRFKLSFERRHLIGRFNVGWQTVPS